MSFEDYHNFLCIILSSCTHLKTLICLLITLCSEQRFPLCSRVSPSTCTFVLGVKRRSPGLCAKHFQPLNHLAGLVVSIFKKLGAGEMTQLLNGGSQLYHFIPYDITSFLMAERVQLCYTTSCTHFYIVKHLNWLLPQLL